jgi:2-oxoglutarate ferredoxin oxidoreductase subunit delta
MADESKEKKGKGTVFVKERLCKGCSFCIDFCPTGAIAFSKEFYQMGYHFPILVKPEKCSGCDLCGQYCPDFAIFGARFKDLDELCQKTG